MPLSACIEDVWKELRRRHVVPATSEGLDGFIFYPPYSNSSLPCDKTLEDIGFQDSTHLYLCCRRRGGSTLSRSMPGGFPADSSGTCQSFLPQDRVLNQYSTDSLVLRIPVQTQVLSLMQALPVPLANTCMIAKVRPFIPMTVYSTDSLIHYEPLSDLDTATCSPEAIVSVSGGHDTNYESGASWFVIFYNPYLQSIRFD